MAASKQVSTDAAAYISPQRQEPQAPAARRSNGTIVTPPTSQQVAPDHERGDIIIEDVVDVAKCVDQLAYEYNMNHPSRGRAVILNHYAYDNKNHPPRHGTQQDVDALKVTLPKIGFHPDDITVHEDLTKKEIIQKMIDLSEEDHSKNDCLMVFVLTHGKSHGRLLARNGYYNVKCLWKPFLAHKCRDLAGKPKMFMLQACRGGECGRIVNVRVHTDGGPVGNKAVMEYKIPSQADFLMAFSTVEGEVSYRHSSTGSWFIQTLCEKLSMPGMTLNNDILRILTRTNHGVAVGNSKFETLTNLAHFTPADTDNPAATAFVTDKAEQGGNKMAEDNTDNPAATAFVTDKAVQGENKMAEDNNDNPAVTALVTDKAVHGGNKMAEDDARRRWYHVLCCCLRKKKAEVHRWTRQAPSFNSSLTREMFFRPKVARRCRAMTD